MLRRLKAQTSGENVPLVPRVVRFEYGSEIWAQETSKACLEGLAQTRRLHKALVPVEECARLEAGTK